MPTQNEFGPCLLTGVGVVKLRRPSIVGGAQAGEASSGWFFDNLVVGNWHLELNDASAAVPSLWQFATGGGLRPTDSFGSLN